MLRLFRLPWRTRRQIAHDVDAELRFHLEAAVSELVARGWRPEEARREALRRFGDLDDARRYINHIDRGTEAAHRRSEWMRDFWQDLLYAGRTLRKSPAFTVVAVLTLALGIGANTAIFSVVDHVLLEPLPFPEPDRLVRVKFTTGGENSSASPVNVLDVRDRAHSFAGASVIDAATVNISADGAEPERALGIGVSASFFDLLGARPALGRGFLPGEDAEGAPRVAVLSDGLWRRLFGADPRVIGRVVRMNGEPTTIVGVAQPGREYPVTGQLWMPTHYDARTMSDQVRGAVWVGIIARLKPGATLESATRDLAAVSAQLTRQFPDDYKEWVMSPVVLRDWLVGDVRKPLLVIMGGVALVLLIACANVANLLLVRATSRESELAIRAALGAGKGRLVRQLVAESLVLSAVGGALGLLVARLAMRGLLGMAADIPRAQSASIDATAIVVTALVCVLTGLAFGILPGLEAARGDLATALRAGARGTRTRAGSSRLKRAIVVAEVALAVTLLTGAGLLLRSFGRLMSVDPGFRTDQVLAFQLSLPDKGYEKEAQMRAFADRLHDDLAALPGARQVAVASSLPLDGHNFYISFSIRGKPKPAPADAPSSQISSISPDYFSVLGIPVVRGRPFAASDVQGAPQVAIVNEKFAKELFPNEDPIGHYIELGWTTDSVHKGGEIVGVVGDVKGLGLEQGSQAIVYLPFAQAPHQGIRVAMKTAIPPSSMASAVRTTVRSIDPQLPIYQLGPMSDMVAASVAQQRFIATLIGGFASVALLLAAVGLYGVVAYVVGQRTHELGVRVALGATRQRIVAMVVREGVGLVVLGLIVGLAASLALGRLIGSLLFGVDAHDPLTFVAVAVALIGVAAIASWLPARRAARVDPLVAMRGD